ncbi:hypothetical protein CDD81_6065 [Ophiocordyceps australis]|uniref:AMP-dependent synthetase/ligase domain-containing protein n=1 Tax=Ophiocordyceps australis TaxID=1399860 RepID=A0A2C5XI10_9HYPO|nr:hypothetical protein CDD81_6065 [Ophiocordyceps australis]
MPFTCPSYVAPLAFEPPDSIPIYEFLFDRSGEYGHLNQASLRPPFRCGLTGKAYQTGEVVERIERLAAAVAAELGVGVGGNELDKVVAIFCVNTIDTMTVSWATHRLGGVSAPISPSYSAPELARQLKAIRAKALFTCVPLLHVALEAARQAGIPKQHVYLLAVPPQMLKEDAPATTDLKTVDELIAQRAEALDKLQWCAGQGARQVAFLCSSSGTSGVPKNVMISHRNVIANVLQVATFESTNGASEPLGNLGVLPLSHCYALIITGHLGVYRGHEVVVLPEFEINQVFKTIAQYRLEILWMVPAMIIGMLKAASIASKYDLGCIKTVTAGASNMDKDMAQQFATLVPNCDFVPGYGLTEAAVAVSWQNRQDILFGSSGSLLPGYEARLLDASGCDIETYNTPGELLLKSPTIVLGYLNDEEATREAMTEDKWLRTGDLVEIRKSEKGHEHIFIVDRIKELIKVRGLQVSPVQLESLLLRHASVSEACVVPIPHDTAGELPFAFVVQTPAAAASLSQSQLSDSLHDFVAAHLAEYKRLAGGIQFVDALPKSAAGKTRRAELRSRAEAVYHGNKTRAISTVLETFEFDDSDEDEE